MKTLIRTTVMLSAIMLLVPALASAQVEESLRFTAPFSFRAGDVLMPAGTYTVTPMSSAPSVLEVTNGRDMALVEVNPTSRLLDKTTPSKPAILFMTQQDGPDVLAQIWDEGDGANVASAFLGHTSMGAEREPAQHVAD